MNRRAKIIQRIERQLATLDDMPGLCLHYAHHTAAILSLCGYKAVIQAGSMQWPMILPSHDDGKMNTHFAYMWTPHDPASAMSQWLGNLPEMHVWVGLPATQELIDFSTRNFQRAAHDFGLTWSAPAPPAYLWCGAANIPPGVGYRPNREATIYACTIIQRLFSPAYLHR